MKLLSSLKKYSWVVLALPLVMAGCSKETLTDINKNTANPADVQAKFILADIITSTAFSNTGGDINTYLTTYIEHEVGVFNQTYYAEMRISQPTTSSTFNNNWGSLYIALKNAKVVIDKCSEGGAQAGNDVTKGMAQVMAAYNLALLTDLFGDAPWSEAGDYNVSLTPKIDKQEAIYKDINAYLDNAIINLQKTDKQAAGSYDLLYSGDKAKWLKFAHGLKARYTMHLLKRSTSVNADLQKVIDHADLSFKSANDQAAYAQYNATNLNPTFDFQWSRDGLAASRSLIDKLIERNDPRLNRSFVNAGWTQLKNIAPNSAEYLLMAKNGDTEQVQYKYNTSIFMFSQTAPTLLLSYHELMFLKAEAMARLNNSASAIEPVLKAAVTAAIANTEVSVKAALSAPTISRYGGISETTAAITETEAGRYFDSNVSPLLAANPLKEIMNQKYISFFGASGESVEAYNDIRRMKANGENFVELKNTKPFPLRLPYGSDDTTTNPNVQAAFGDGQYVYSAPVWWAGGTR